MAERASARGRRLHPMSPVFDITGSMRNLIMIGLFALWAAQGDTSEVVMGVILALGAAFQSVQYFLTWYRLDPTELVVSRGILFRSERHIPYARIENMDLKRGPLHRLFGVAEARVQTASGAAPEAVLRVLSMSAIDQIRAHISEGRARERHEELPREMGTPARDDGVVLVRLGLRDLAQLGIVSNRGLVVFAAGVGLVWQFGLEDPIERLMEDAGKTLAGLDVITTVVGAVVGTVLVIALFCAFSIGLAIVRFYGFTLRRVGEDFRIRCGLFTEHASSVPRPHVQFVSVRASPLHRLIGRVSIRVETAGGIGEGDAMISRKSFVPLIRTSEAERIVGDIFPGLAFENVQWRGLGPGALRRMLIKALVWWAAIMAIAILVTMDGLPAWVVPGASVAVLPLVVWHTIRTARFTGYARAGDAIWFRSGAWTRRTSVTLEGRIQVTSLRETPFDRRYGHATVALDTAGAGPAGHAIRIPYLDAAGAGSLRRALASAV